MDTESFRKKMPLKVYWSWQMERENTDCWKW